jgi:hypothetical protein
MTTRSTSQHFPPGRHPRPAGKVDFTFMYAAHDAFNRDLRRLAAAAGSGRTADPAVRTGWATFKNQLHVHHTDTSTRLLGMLPPAARLLYRALWRPGYARTPRWATAIT